MTLASLLTVLEGNLNLMLTIIDGNPVITFDATGGPAISSELGAREVDRIGIVDGENHFNIYLKALPEPEPDDNEPEVPTDEP